MVDNNLVTKKQEIFNYVNAFLGGGMVDVELDPIHYEAALTKALSRYRMRSDHSVEESYVSLKLVQDQNDYILPSEIMEVQQIYRRSVGSRPMSGSQAGPLYSQSYVATANQQIFTVNYNLNSIGTIIVTIDGTESSNYATDSGARTITVNTPLTAGTVVGVKLYAVGESTTGSLFDPFNLAYSNAYLLSKQNTGGLTTYELFSQYQELIGRMFGSFMEFTWNSSTKKLTILQRPRAEEEVLLEVFMFRPDVQLLDDYLAKQWIKDYTLASCKYMLGEAREKFATIAGPQGGTSLNGSSLKAEAQSEMEKLENEVAMAMAGGTGYAFTIG
jgi:hypothetical protein